MKKRIAAGLVGIMVFGTSLASAAKAAQKSASSQAPESSSTSGDNSLGGFIDFSHYAIADQEADITTQGVTYLRSLSPRVRVGGNLGVFVSHRSGDTGGTVLGFSVSPAASYDLITKPGGRFYAVTHSLGFDMVHGSGNTPDVWNLNILNAGLGIEALVSRDVGVSLEGDVFNLGMTQALSNSELTVSGIAFPTVRLAIRMYY
jgi:hypothetical protein